jgi:membrane protein
MFHPLSFSWFWQTLKKSVSKFLDDNGIKLSASLSYYTIFAMPPMLIIIFSLSGFFFGKEAVQGEVYGQIRGLVGSDAAIQIQEIIKNVHLSGDNLFTTVISVVTLVIGSTGVFAEIQDSINLIWGIKAKPRRGWLKWIANRLLSFSMIISIGFLLLVSLTINTLMDILSARLQVYFTNLAVQVFYVLNLLLVFTVITSLFAIIFKMLPDGRVKLGDTLRGAAFTAVLFMIGKFLIGYYLGHSSVTSIYGAAGSIIVILLWVYYSSIILYFGAEFTMVYACTFGKKIIPNDYAVFVEQREIEQPGKTAAVKSEASTN